MRNPLQRLASGKPELAHGPAGEQADFNGADELRSVVGMNCLGGATVQAGQHAMQVA